MLSTGDPDDPETGLGGRIGNSLPNIETTGDISAQIWDRADRVSHRSNAKDIYATDDQTLRPLEASKKAVNNYRLGSWINRKW